MTPKEYPGISQDIQIEGGGKIAFIMLKLADYPMDSIAKAVARSLIELCQGEVFEVEKQNMQIPLNEEGIEFIYKNIMFWMECRDTPSIMGHSAKNGEGKFDVKTNFQIFPQGDECKLQVAGPHGLNYTEDCPRLTLDHILYNLTCVD